MIKTRYGEMEVPGDDDTIGRSLKEYGEWAQQEIELLLSLLNPGAVILDVGAFIGTHTLAFASIEGATVYSFEPQPVAFELLNKTIQQNNIKNVRLYNAALSQEPGAIFITSEGALSSAENLGSFSLANKRNTDAGTVGEATKVELITIDELRLETCNLIKIDAEGMEHLVLLGASRALMQLRPLIYAECNSVESGAKSLEVLWSHGYAVYLHISNAFNSDNYNCNPSNVFGETKEIGLLGVPREEPGIISKIAQGCDLIPVNVLDDLVLGMLKKPQYKEEVLEKSDAGKVLGTSFFITESELRQLKDSMSRTSERLMQTETLLARINDENASLRRLEKELKSSVSWRVTSPLRLAGGFAKRLRVTIRVKNSITREVKRLLLKKIRRELNAKATTKGIALFISHSNYLVHMGGTEKYIYEHIVDLQKRRVVCVSVAPDGDYDLLGQGASNYNIIIDGIPKAVVSATELVEILKPLQEKVIAVYVHHFLNWQYGDYLKIIETLNPKQIYYSYYVHDLFAIEPTIVHGRKLPLVSQKEWSALFTQVLEPMESIICPSKFARDKFIKAFPQVATKARIVPHLKLKANGRSASRPANNRIRLGFMGLAIEHKGWHLWERLINDPELQNVYDFYHFGCGSEYARNVKCIQYSFAKSGLMGASDLLIAHKIDLVLLWSLAPETYSFTMMESIAAGVPILTSSGSGNIAATVSASKGKLGRVYESESGLLADLANVASLEPLMGKQRFTYALTFNNRGDI